MSTDDAYVGAVFAQVTPQIEGTIGAVRVHDTQYVHKGDVLVTLDPKDAQLDFEAAKATYEEAYRRVQQEVADANAAEANVLAKQSLVAQAEQQLRRRTSIRQSGVVAAEEISNSRSALDAAKYALSIAENQLTAKRALAAPIASNPEMLEASTNLERARLRLERTSVRAPVDGIVAQSRIQIGQQIAAGTELMTVVPIRQLFVEANFKESQIAQIRPGQLVTLNVRHLWLGPDLPRLCRGRGRWNRRGLRGHPSAECDGQLDQGRAAPADTHRARSGGTQRQSVARGYFDDRRRASGPVCFACSSRCVEAEELALRPDASGVY